MMTRRNPILLTLLLVPVFVFGCLWQASAATNVALGKSYTYSAEPDGSYPDAGGALTDGKYGQEFAWGEENLGPHKDTAWAASKEQTWVITIDLASLHTVDQVRTNFLKFGGAAIRHPQQIAVAVSVDGTNWTNLGSSTFVHKDMPQGATMTTFYGRGVEARYVRVTTNREGQWTFVDEIEVLGSAKN